MTLDVLHFIESKGGNPNEIRESQRKRGLSVELVDEVISNGSRVCDYLDILLFYLRGCSVDFDDNSLNKEANALQKEITAKKKVPILLPLIHASYSLAGQGECR
jgi:seryl-tRNA synthetase